MKRVFLIVLDSFGIGEMEDAASYGDFNVNTLRSVSSSCRLSIPNLRELGLFNIDGVTVGEQVANPKAAYGRMAERSKGKDTTIGKLPECIHPNPCPHIPMASRRMYWMHFRLLPAEAYSVISHIPERQ